MSFKARYKILFLMELPSCCFLSSFKAIMINRTQNGETFCRDSRQRAGVTKQNFQLVDRLGFPLLALHHSLHIPLHQNCKIYNVRGFFLS